MPSRPPCPPTVAALRSLVFVAAVVVAAMPALADVCCAPAGGCTMYDATTNPCTGSVRLTGVTCSPNPCVGACCDLGTGACAFTGMTTCAGQWHGYSTTCTVGACDGVCCNAGACTSPPPVSGCVGTYQGQGSACSPTLCPQPGACCDGFLGTCRIRLVTECGVTGFQGGNTTCLPSPCGGACCTSNGGCTFTGPNGCSGIYTAHGSCGTPCPPTGACCGAAGACTLIIAYACTSGSVWIAGACPSVSCSGACCNRWTGGCAVEDPAKCVQLGLRFNGLSSVCSAATCIACPSDFDGSGGLAVADIFAFLNSWFAGCP